MTQITIVTPFTFTHQDGRSEQFPVGTYDIVDSLATHWFIAAHSDHPPEVEPALGTPEYAQKQARIKARAAIIDAAVEQEAEAARVQVRMRGPKREE